MSLRTWRYIGGPGSSVYAYDTGAVVLVNEYKGGCVAVVGHALVQKKDDPRTWELVPTNSEERFTKMEQELALRDQLTATGKTRIEELGEQVSSLTEQLLDAHRKLREYAEYAVSLVDSNEAGALSIADGGELSLWSRIFGSTK